VRNEDGYEILGMEYGYIYLLTFILCNYCMLMLSVCFFAKMLKNTRTGQLFKDGTDLCYGLRLSLGTAVINLRQLRVER
jgi:hypothetical protein